MVVDNGENKGENKGNKGKKWIWGVGAVLLLSLLLFVALPLGTKYYLEEWLVKNGAEKATIKSLWFNPLQGKFLLNGVDIIQDGQPRMEHSALSVTVDFFSLFQKDIRFSDVHYSNMLIDVEQLKDGNWRIASYTIKEDGERAAEPVQTGENLVKESDSPEKSWAFLADNVVLRDCRVVLKTPLYQFDLLINKAELIELSTREGAPAGKVNLDATLNGEKVIISLGSLQLVPHLALAGDIDLGGFDLQRLDRLLESVLPVFAGMVEGAGHVDFVMDDSGMKVEYDGKIAVEKPDIGSQSFATRSEKLSWAGKIKYDATTNAAMVVKLDGQLAAKDYFLSLPSENFSTRENSIEIGGKSEITIGDTVAVKKDGPILLTGISLETPEVSVTEDKINWNGAVNYGVVGSDGDSRLGVKGQLDLDLVDVILKESGMRIVQEKLGMNADLHVQFGTLVDINGVYSFTADNFRLFEQQTAENPLVSLASLDVAQLKGNGGEHLEIEELSAETLVVAVEGDMPLDINVPRLFLRGVKTEDLQHFMIDELSLQKPGIMAAHNDRNLLDLQSLVLEKISADTGGDASFDRLFLDDLVFLGVKGDEKEVPGVICDGAELRDITWTTESGFHGKSLEFSGVKVNAARDKEGLINFSRSLAAMRTEGTEPEKSTEKKESGSSVPIVIGKMFISGDSRLQFKDYTLAVPYVTDLAINELTVTELDSTKPEQKTEIVLKGQFEGRAPVHLQGTISPFMEKLAMDMKLKLKNYPLSFLSAYTVQSVGTALASGQLKLTTDLKLKDDYLDMKNTVVLKELKTEKISRKLADELDNQLPVPLDTALSLLEDNKKTIKLSVPLTGPTDDLKVGIADVLITALGKAIVPAVSGYLMYTLGPAGALAYVGMKVGEHVMSLTLPPVIFEKGEIELTQEHKTYLERIAKLLTERPDTDIELTPRVSAYALMTEQEEAAPELAGKKPVLNEETIAALQERGQEMAKIVQQHLEEICGAGADRLLIAETVIEKKKDAVSAVYLEL